MHDRSRDSTMSLLVRGLGDGRASAAEFLVRRVYGDVVRLAMGMMRGGEGRAVYDADDAANSALARICRASAARKLGWLNGREQFWGRVRTVVARRIAADRERRGAARRGGDAHRCGGAAPPEAGPDGLAAAAPSPAELALAEMEVDRLLGLLPDPMLRRIAEMRMEGHTVADVSLALRRPISTIERKLRLIREIWRRA